MRTGMIALSASDGSTLVAWNQDGQTEWQLYDAKGRASRTTGSAKCSGKGVAGVKIGSAQLAAFQSPIILPSGSENQANVPLGIVTGGTRVLPPRDSAFANAAATSGTST